MRRRRERRLCGSVKRENERDARERRIQRLWGVSMEEENLFLWFVFAGTASKLAEEGTAESITWEQANVVDLL
ncbi:putative receptor protein kinase [Corchorus olitorius]|uniref:Receptor protein kinase n=1 Tax=Corchorus olitorius TaxID=93759 RepID=A0A1R3HJR0_9ROSI|nr:putative receptor protein kinase [Corchorus olitorius]